MATILIRRGNESNLPVLSAGEPGFTTDTHVLFIGDGSSNHEVAMMEILNDSSSNTTSGASKIGVYDEFTNSNSSNVQDVLKDFDTALVNGNTVYDSQITIQPNNGLTGGGSFTLNQNSNATITVSHADTSSQSSVDNSNGTVIQDVTLDDYGHITSLASVNLDSRYPLKSYGLYSHRDNISIPSSSAGDWIRIGESAYDSGNYGERFEANFKIQFTGGYFQPGSISFRVFKNYSTGPFEIDFIEQFGAGNYFSQIRVVSDNDPDDYFYLEVKLTNGDSNTRSFTLLWAPTLSINDFTIYSTAQIISTTPAKIHDIKNIYNGLHLSILRINDNIAWHAGNDGSGSGLDADLLDGYHASSFATASHNHDSRYVNVTGDTMTGLLNTTKTYTVFSLTGTSWRGFDWKSSSSVEPEGRFLFDQSIATFKFEYRPTNQSSPEYTTYFTKDGIQIGDTSNNGNASLKVITDNTHIASIEAYGNTQGTGKLFVGQDSAYGGGIIYNGDDNPNISQTADAVSFYRRSSNTEYQVFYYMHNSNNVYFHGDTSANNVTARNYLMINEWKIEQDSSDDSLTYTFTG